jgi:hypothetical protein
MIAMLLVQHVLRVTIRFACLAREGHSNQMLCLQPKGASP